VTDRRRGTPTPRLHHLALRVSDCERSLAFYSGFLGLSEVRRLRTGGVLRAVWLAADGVVIMLEKSLRGAGPASGSGHVLSFAAADLPAWEERLAAAGVPIDDRTAETLFVRDPDGHRVGLSAHRFPDEFFAPGR
jgi:catechol 2,3-dioxygenase-like lactoylglutathione lyase family enzyme